MTAISFDKYDRKGAYHWYDYFGSLLRMNAYTRARYDIVLQCVQASGANCGSRLLEVGCGDGALLALLRIRLDAVVTGIDTCDKGLTLARLMFQKNGLVGEFRQVGGDSTGFPDASFDIVVCSDVIEHVEDPQATLLEIRRLLVPGGHLIISTPIRFSEEPQDPMHVQEWYVGGFVDLCAKIFGDPEEVIRSHPMIWYELVSSSIPWVGRFGRLLTNLLTRLGRNPLLECGGVWRCYTTQTLVLAKSSIG